MSDSTIVTGQYVQIDQTPASLGARILGRLIDTVLLLVYCAAVFGLWIAYMQMTGGEPSPFGSFLILSVFYLPALGYTFFWETFNNGQTPGKRFLGMRVVMKNGDRPTVAAYLFRWLFLLIDMHTSYVGILCIALTKNNQRVGDLAAGTLVIKEKDYKKIHVTLDEFSHLNHDYQPVFPQAERLSLAQVDLINRTLTGGDRQTRPERIRQLANEVRRFLGLADNGTADEALLRTLVRDYQHYALEAAV